MEPAIPDLDALAAQFVEDDEDRRYHAAYRLQEMGLPALPVALKAASDPDPCLRQMGCFVLGQLRDECPEACGPDGPMLLRDGVPVILQLLRSDPEPEVRSAAASALGHQAVPEALPELCAAAVDPDEGVRFSVSIALSRYHVGFWGKPEYQPHRDPVIETLLKLMGDPDEGVRDWSTFAVQQGRHDTPELRARLWMLLDDSSLPARGQAAEALGSFGDRSLVPVLDRLLREAEELHTGYFQAAEALGDPCLLPAMEEGAGRWAEQLAPGEKLDVLVHWSVQSLREVAGVQAAP